MNFFSWKTVPFVRFIFPLILGIVSAVFVAIPIEVAAGLLMIGALGLLVTLKTMDFRRRILLEKWSLFFISAMIFGLGIWSVDLHSSLDESDHFSKRHSGSFLKARVTESPVAKKKSMKAVLEVEQVLVDSTWIPSCGSVLIYFEKSLEAQELEIGDELLLPTGAKEVSAPSNPGEFNYKRFLSFRDIYHQQYLPKGNWKKVGESWSPRKQSERWRSQIRGLIADIHMDTKEEAIASALLLGKKDELDPELIKSYASAGAMHVLAVSGLHVGIIYFILKALLSWMKGFRHSAMMKALILILCLWVYAFITGLSPSVVRAATMFSAMTLATGLGRKSNIYNTVASSAFMLLVFNPFYIMEVGFQLSYLAVLGIIYLFPKIYSIFYFPSWLSDRIWQISCVSIAAQLATFPLGLLYFHQFPSYFLLSNLLVIPAAFLILYLGFAYILFSWVPVLGELLGKVLSIAIRLLNQAVAWVESLPYSLVTGVDISILEAWTLNFMTILFSLGIIKLRKSFLVTALSASAALMIWQVYDLHDYQRHPSLIVYDVRGESVVNVLSDLENLVFCSKSIELDPSKQQFHLRNNWNRYSAPEPKFMSNSILAKTLVPGLFLSHGKSIYHLDSKASLDSIGGLVKVDYLILSYFKGLNMSKVLEHVDPAKIILDSTIRPWHIERICEDAEGHIIHVVEEDGYFSTRL